MTKKIVDKPYTIDMHGNITYTTTTKPEVVEAHEEPMTDVSIDTLLRRGLSTIDRIMKSCLAEVKSGETPSRESVMNLKDCMTMLKDLKAQEDALLDTMSDEEIEDYLRAKKNDN